MRRDAERATAIVADEFGADNLKGLAFRCSYETDPAAKLVNFPGVRIALVRDARAISG